MRELGQPLQQGQRAPPGPWLCCGVLKHHQQRVWFGQSSPSSSGGPWSPFLSTLGLPHPTSQAYRILKISAELLVLYRKWIQKVLTEVSVGDEEGHRVNLQVKPDP